MTEFKPGERVQQRDRDGILHRGTVEGVFDDGCVYGTRDAGGRFVVWPGDLTKVDDEPKPLRFEDVRDGDTITVTNGETTVTGVASVGRLGDTMRVGSFGLWRYTGGEWHDNDANPATPEYQLTAHTRAPAEPEIADPAPLRFEDVRTGDTITVEGEDYSITGTGWTEPGDPPRVTVGGVTVFNFDGDEGTHGPYGPPVRLTAHIPAEPEWHRAKVIMGCYTEAGTPDEPEYWLLGWDGLFYSVSGAAEDYELTNVTIIVDKHGRVRA